MVNEERGTRDWTLETAAAAEDWNMNDRPRAGWIGLSLLILLISTWLGYGLGRGIAEVRIQAQNRGVGLEAMSSSLSKSYAIRLGAVREAQSGGFQREVESLRQLAMQPDSVVAKPAIDLFAAIALLQMASVERRDGKTEEAEKQSKLAEESLRLLGWQDCSPVTLETAERKEADRWRFAESTGAAQR